MRTIIRNVWLVAGALTVTASASQAVNCEQVRRYLKTGRSVDEVADSMIVDVNEVKKCAEEKPAKGGAPPQPAATPGK